MPGLKKLKHLNLRRNAIVDLPEQEQRSLDFLDISNNQVEKLDFLQGCPNLRELRLEGNEVEELDPLSACPNLQILDLSRNG